MWSEERETGKSSRLLSVQRDDDDGDSHEEGPVQCGDSHEEGPVQRGDSH